MSRKDINVNNKITDAVIKIAMKSKQNNLDFVVGGAISKEALKDLKKINKTHLNRFETRKVIFDKSSLEMANIKDGLLKAVNFELLWLKNKKNYYGEIYREDNKRIDMLSKR